MMPKLMDAMGSAAAAGADQKMESASSPAADSGIRRFEPADGLFLRAEHLRQIEDYARDLSLLNGLAGGPGVVYGYTLDLDAAKKVVGATAGLAVDPSGQPLRSQVRLEVDLSGLAHGDRNRIWIVEVIAAGSIPAGSEPLYSSVCSTPCATESSIQPWRDDAVQLRVRAETLYGDWSNTRSGRRLLSALVSAYFDQERRDGDPWLTPAAPGAAVPVLSSRRWGHAAPEAAPGPAGVPLGLLAWIDGAWVLDVWSARRDRMLTPPDTAWHNHLGLRPRPVFMAQVLQFADQLDGKHLSPTKPLTWWFGELPPAGFLPVPTNIGEGQGRKPPQALRQWLNDIFANKAQLVIETCSADVALSTVALAQHQDRIPLLDAETDSRPWVLILVPSIRADLPAVATARYGWVAFVRVPRIGSFEIGRFSGRQPQWAPESEDEVAVDEAAESDMAAGDVATGDVAAGEAPDEASNVGVHVLIAPSFRGQYVRGVVNAAAEPSTADVSFPGTGWAPPNDDKVMGSIREAITRDGGRLADVVVTTADAGREPLMAARARALVMQLGFAEPESPAGVFPVVVDGPDAIYLMVRHARSGARGA